MVKEKVLFVLKFLILLQRWIQVFPGLWFWKVQVKVDPDISQSVRYSQTVPSKEFTKLIYKLRGIARKSTACTYSM
jgi:hypothetical protein